MIVERFPPDVGGLARSGRRIAAAVAELGMTVHVLSWSRQLPAGALETADVARGLTAHRVGLFAEWDTSLQHTMNVLEWLHGRERFDAVWGHYLYPAGFAAVLFGETFGVPSTVSARGNDVDRLTFPPGDFARLLWTLRRAGVVTAVSQDLRRKIGVLLGHDAGVEIVPNVVDLETFRPGPPDPQLRQGLGIAADEAVLGFSGELRLKKGTDFLFAALREVRRTRPACLLVIGEARTQDRAKLAAFAAECPRDAGRVLVTRHLDDPAAVAEHLRLCDVYVQPSLWEGTPNALLEAMACGRACVASDAGGIPDVIEHGASGFVLPKHALGRLGEAVLELLALPPAERDAFGRAARLRAEQAFHPTAEAAALRRVFRRLIPRTEA
jgi:glycosyltransferase involved in cell wall biosynthesis